MLKTRADEPELMDDFSSGGEDLREALRQLKRLNRMLGAAGPVLSGVRRMWTEAGQPATLDVTDVGAGSGDINRRLLRWAERNAVLLRLVLVDKSEEACEEARLLYAGDSRVEVRQGDLFQLPAASADIVTASQFAHHFGSKELPAVMRRLLEISRLGVVIGDIHRHPIPWLAVWGVTRLLSRNRYIRHDGPLSVAKGFRAADWRHLQSAAGIALNYRWKPLFRYVVTAVRSREEATLP